MRCLSFYVVFKGWLCVCMRKEGHNVDDTCVLLLCGGGAIVSDCGAAPDIVLLETKTDARLFREIVSDDLELGLVLSLCV